MKLFDDTFGVIQKALDLRFKRHEVLASNIANSETPNFKARELDFAGELQKAINPNAGVIARTDPGHMDIGAEAGSHITYDTSGAMGSDGNNVDLDIMTGKISGNSAAFDEAASFLMIKLRMLRDIANSRGGL